MANELITIDNNVNALIESMPEHKDMLVHIQENLPEIHRASSLFGKTQSQFMDNMLTVSHPTDIRNIRQILAEIQKSMSALKEAYFNNKKKEVEIRIKLDEVEQEKNPLKKELLQIEADEMRMQLESSQLYISGAIRRITNYNEQYKNLTEKVMKEQGVDNFNEIDFEAEEEKYHIMKAFDQGLCAARAHHGMIDEGNQIYLQQIGINGALAQRYVTLYLQNETELIVKNIAPQHSHVLDFLKQMAEKFKGCSQKYAEYKGMTLKTDLALLEKGDCRLLLMEE